MEDPLGKLEDLRGMVIGVTGMIGAGKTTFIQHVAESVNYVAREKICKIFIEQPDKKLLSLYLSNPTCYATVFQQYMLQTAAERTQRAFDWIKDHPLGIALVERPTVENILFSTANRSMMDSSYPEFYEQCFKTINRLPDLIVNLRVSKEILIGRVCIRNRPGEQESYLNGGQQYFDTLFDLYEKYSKDCREQIFNVDWNTLNFDDEDYADHIFTTLETIATKEIHCQIDKILMKHFKTI
jgi:deoxyadenosine/deoxycytidine kinase